MGNYSILLLISLKEEEGKKALHGIEVASLLLLPSRSEEEKVLEVIGG